MALTFGDFLSIFTTNDPSGGRAIKATFDTGIDDAANYLTKNDPAGGRAIKVINVGAPLGPQFWAEAYNAGTQATSSWTPAGAATNINAAIIPKGTGAIVADIPDGTVTGGNARGQYAVDLQMVRTAATQVASATSSFIGGGQLNTNDSSNSVIVGGYNNLMGSYYSFIGGGSGNQSNTANNSGWHVICGGNNNRTNGGAGHNYVSILGGENNNASGTHSTIGGGSTNATTVYLAAVFAGASNTASGAAAFIGGGSSNTASGERSVVAGGLSNTASAIYTTVAGGRQNGAGADYGTVGGGYINSAAGQFSFVGGGTQNYAGFTYDTICGGELNSLAGTNNSANRFIGGGTRNTINAEQTVSATICGGQGNTIYFGSAGGFIGGGGRAAFPGGNYLSGLNSAIVGGEGNRIGNGYGNYATYAFIGGGGSNVVDTNADASVVSGGSSNIVRANVTYATIPGGYQAAASLYGQVAHASGQFSAQGDAQAHELIWRRAITGTGATELFLDGASIRAILPGTNSIWHGTIDAVAVCTVTGDGSTTVGHVEATSYKVTIKRIGTSTSLVGTVQEIGTTNADTSMSTASFSIDNDDTNEALRIRFTPPATAGSTTVIRAVATFRGTQIQY